MPANKMNPEVKAKWLAALRSGKYKQGKGSLRTEKNEFCCLGVLCEVARIDGAIPNPVHMVPRWDPAGSTKQWFYGKGRIDDERRNGTLPEVVQEWAGLHACNPFVGVVGTLAHANDSLGKSFEEIADLIEEHL